MEKPLVSVVLCCYNGARFLGGQIDSILNQSYQPLELIISDDGSDDGTRSLLKQYEMNPAVKIFYRGKNAGLNQNFAFAAQQAKGELIAFSDQDDVWGKNKIELLVGAIGTGPLVYSNSLLMDEEGRSMDKKLTDLKKMYSGDDSRGYILSSCVWGHSMLVTRDLLQRCSPKFSEIQYDIWLAFQAFLNGGIKYSDKVLTHYRQHTASASKSLPQKQPTRKRTERYHDYKKKLEWIELMQQNERPAFQPFYQELLKLYSQKEHRRYVFPLVRFMLQYRKEIFMFSRKSFASQLVEILKQGRGERP